MDKEASFAALISSRICHDLISPVGAINNGIELIQMTTPSLGPEMALISESVTNASARIRFLRIAFGAAGEQTVGTSEISSILKDVYADTRITVFWAPTEGMSRKDVRLAFLALMCFETAMPYGGRIDVVQEDGGLNLTSRADKFKIDETLWSFDTNAKSETPLRASQVQFGLLPVHAREDGVSIKTDIADDKISFSFSVQ